MSDPSRSITGGVDTHKDFHVAAAIDGLGRILGTEQFPTTPRGYRRLLRWLRRFGDVAAVGVEGTGAWGAGLARHLTGEGVRVVEVDRPNRQKRRRRGKSHPADAEAAARAVLAGEATGTPKAATGAIEAIRLVRVARRSAMKARTQAANQIHSVIDTAPEQLRATLLGLREAERIAKASRLRAGDPATPLGAAKLTLSTLAKRWIALTEEIKILDAQLDTLVETAAPSLVAAKGIGTETASMLLTTAGDNADRLKNERSFAAVCGSSPVDASSGKQQRHRLNSGGDRQANCALYLIVLNRLSWDQRTKDYMKRRLAEGKTKKEVIR
ncbi:MAG TPA: IS110 family transposase [Acidimicrobiales bacterium]|jgi:transposase|nr:IS110 family transposase [Acidimicrobiales bacterium]